MGAVTEAVLAVTSVLADLLATAAPAMLSGAMPEALLASSLAVVDAALLRMAVITLARDASAAELVGFTAAAELTGCTAAAEIAGLVAVAAAVLAGIVTAELAGPLAAVLAGTVAATGLAAAELAARAA